MIFRKFKKVPILLLIAAGMAVAMTGCIRDGGSGSPSSATDNEVTITVNIPGQQIPETRSIDGASEAAVKTIDILVFDDAIEPKLTEHAKGMNIEPVEGASNYKVTFKAVLSKNDDAGTIVIIANASDEVDGIVNKDGDKSAYGSSKEDILEALVFGPVSGSRWNAVSSTNYTPIPMYGEVPVASGIDPATTEIPPIDLTRMLARIDVVNNVTTQFTLSEVYLVNYNTVGRIASAWDGDKPVLNIPDDPSPKTGEATKLTYSGTELVGGIYTFEAAAHSDPTTHDEAICLIVKGKKTGDANDSYYRIDFTGDNTDLEPDKVKYMPVYRNHLYRFDITAVTGSGYGSFGEALNSLGMVNNLKTTLHEINLSEITDMVFNAQYFIGLGDAVTFGYQKSVSAVSVKCVTNYWDGWSIDTSKGTNGVTGGSGWLTVSEGTDQITLSTSSDNYTINAAGTDRVATVHIKAGRLTHQLTVTQKGERITVTVAPTTLTLASTAVTGTTSFTVTCKDSQGAAANVAWTLTSGDATWLRMDLSNSKTFATCATAGTVSGTGTRIVYVYATANTSTSPNRTTTIKRGTTTVVNVTQTYLSACFPAYPGIIGYDPVVGDLNLEGRGIMVQFKHCGVVGMYAELSGAWRTDGSPIAFNPTNITITEYNSFPTPVRTDYATIGSKVTPYHTLDGLKNGNGDPCRLIGYTAAQVKSLLSAGTTPDNLLWRSPSDAELKNYGTASVASRASPSNATEYEGHVCTALNNGSTFTAGWDFVPKWKLRSAVSGNVQGSSTTFHTETHEWSAIDSAGYVWDLITYLGMSSWNNSTGKPASTGGQCGGKPIRCVSQ